MNSVGVLHRSAYLSGLCHQSFSGEGQIVDAHGERLERVLTACSFLVDGTSTRDRTLVLAPGAVVDVLPPFAGG